MFSDTEFADLTRSYTFFVDGDKDLQLCLTYRRFYDGSEYPGIIVTLKDRFNQSTTTLGAYHCGRWTFTNRFNCRTFWNYVKANSWDIKRAVDKLRHTNPDDSFKMEWSIFKRRFRLESFKITRKIKLPLL